MIEQALKNGKTLTRKKSKAYREINTIIAVMAREIDRKSTRLNSSHT